MATKKSSTKTADITTVPPVFSAGEAVIVNQGQHKGRRGTTKELSRTPQFRLPDQVMPVPEIAEQRGLSWFGWLWWVRLDGDEHESRLFWESELDPSRSDLHDDARFSKRTSRQTHFER